MVNKPKNKKVSFLVISFLLLFLFLGLSLLSFFYSGSDSEKQNNQEIKFWLYSGDKQIVGEKNNFFVFIENKEKRDLENIEVILNFPSGFIFDSSFPICETKLSQGGIWTFDKIKKNSLQEIEIKGTFFGQPENPQYIEGVMNFNLSGFTSVYQKTFSQPVILDPVLLLNWEMPGQSSFGQEINSSLSLENTSQDIISKTEVIITWPKGFSLSNFDQKKGLEKVEVNESQRQIKWTIKDLNSKDKKRLQFSGKIKDPLAEELDFYLRSGLIVNNSFFEQSQKEKKVLLEKFDFQPVLKINDSIKEVQSCQWGDNLLLELSYNNKTNQTIEDLILKLNITKKQYLDFNDLYQSNWQYYSEEKSEANSFYSGQITNSIISSSDLDKEKGWSFSSIPDLNKILPEEKGKIVLNLPIKEYLDLPSNISSAQIGFQMAVKGKSQNQEINWEILSNKINLSIKTDLTLNSSVRYWNDEHVVIGQGPLPPKVGEETRFWIFWQLKNTTNIVEDINIETKLPVGVSWTGNTQASQGLILYDRKNRTVNWQISQLEPYQGGSYSLVESSFEIAVRPTEDLLNKTIPLTENIYLTAKDQLTGELLNQNIDFLDTSLENDPWFHGSGKVIKEEE